MLRFIEIIERASSGPLCTEKEFNMKVFVPTLRALIKKYDIRFDPACVVPADDALADRIFEAGFELYRQVGTLCVDTSRIIRFSADELREALATAPRNPVFGEGKDAKAYPTRRPESDVPPWCYVGAGGTPMSDERLFEAVVQAAGEVPLGDGLTAPSLATVDGVPVRAGTPVEIMACIKSTLLTREGLRKAGRAGMPVQNAIATAASAQGKIAGSHFGMRPSDGWLIGATVDLKADWERLSEVAFVTALGGHIVAETCPMLGGYCGGPEGLAVANVAYHLQSILVFQGSYHLNFSIDLRTSCGTGRGVIWGTSASAQAIARNSHFPLQTSGLVASGPGTEMQCYEAAAPVIAHVVSGSSVGPTGGSPGNAVTDHVNPLNGSWCAEVAHGSVGLSRAEANTIVNALLERYETSIADAPRGKRFQDLYDVSTLTPNSDLREMYARAKTELAGMGLRFIY